MENVRFIIHNHQIFLDKSHFHDILHFTMLKRMNGGAKMELTYHRKGDYDLYGEYFEKKQNLFLGIFLRNNPGEFSMNALLKQPHFC